MFARNLVAAAAGFIVTSGRDACGQGEACCGAVGNEMGWEGERGREREGKRRLQHRAAIGRAISQMRVLLDAAAAHVTIITRAHERGKQSAMMRQEHKHRAGEVKLVFPRQLRLRGRREGE